MKHFPPSLLTKVTCVERVCTYSDLGPKGIIHPQILVELVIEIVEARY